MLLGRSLENPDGSEKYSTGAMSPEQHRPSTIIVVSLKNNVTPAIRWVSAKNAAYK